MFFSFAFMLKVVCGMGYSQSVQWPGYGLDKQSLIPSMARDIFLYCCNQTDSEAHPAFYPMDTLDSYSGVKQLQHEAGRSLQ